MLTLDLKGKTILAIGAKGFLGSYLTWALILEEAAVIGTDLRGDANTKILDITDSGEVDDFVSEIALQGISLDGVVNCSMASFKGKDISEDKFNQALSVNIRGAHNCMDMLRPIMSEQASVVNVSSVFGSRVPDFSNYDGQEDLFNNVSYGCSKSAVEYITKYYAKLYAPIRYNSVAPGGIFQDHSDEFVNKYSRRVALNRMADPEEVVSAILFLLSPLSSYITGTNLKVDGGFGL